MRIRKIESVTATNGNIVDSLAGSSTTDAPSVNAVNNKFNEINSKFDNIIAYSLEEQIIGMCLKKPLYRKSFLINSSSQINENVIGRISNIDLIINIYGTMAIAGYITPLNSVWNDANTDLSVLVQVQSSNGDVIINQKSTPAKYPIFITIEYTKTTD